jgi:hypothetical protein
VDPRRLSFGEWIAGACGLLVVVSLFLPWYSAGGHDLTAWQAMTVDDVILALTGLGAIVAAVMAALHPGRPVPMQFIVLAGVGGVIGAIVAVWRVVDPAPPGDVGLGLGAWLGLVGALGVAAGAMAGAADEGPARRSQQSAERAARAAQAAAELVSLPAERGMGS